MPVPSIATQVDHFNEGFTAQIGPELSAIFDAEQTALRDSGIPDGAVTAGDTLPDAELVDVNGATVALSAVIAGTTSVVVFYRGSWCPYCNLTLKTYQEALLPALQERVVRLVAISPQTPTATELAVTNGDLAFPVLSDPGNILIERLGILTEPTADARAAHSQLGFDVADSNADASGNIPFPTVLVVDSAGRVAFADVHVDYTTRTEVADILAAVDAVTAPTA